MVKEYVPKCRRALDCGKLKRGGTSAAEKILSDVFEHLKLEVREGERPE